VLIPPYNGPAVAPNVNIELGNDPDYQLFRLDADLGEQQNLAKMRPDKLREMISAYEQILDTTDSVSE
jgi:hypothetical protein